MRDIPLLMVAQKPNLSSAIDTWAIRIFDSIVKLLHILLLTPVFYDDRAAAAHAFEPLK